MSASTPPSGFWTTPRSYLLIGGATFAKRLRFSLPPDLHLQTFIPSWTAPPRDVFAIVTRDRGTPALADLLRSGYRADAVVECHAEAGVIRELDHRPANIPVSLPVAGARKAQDGAGQRRDRQHRDRPSRLPAPTAGQAVGHFAGLPQPAHRGATP